MSKKPWLLLTQAEKDMYWSADGGPPGLLAAGLHATMEKNKELRKEIKKLKEELKEYKNASK